jgi:hypothetical protein
MSSPLNWSRSASFACDQPRKILTLRICGPTKLAGFFSSCGLPLIIRQKCDLQKSQLTNSNAAEKCEIVFAYLSYRKKL